MTKEEATKELKIELSMWESDCKSYHKTKEALKMAIKALEQENMLFKSGLLKDCESCKAKQVSILDKIRAEIEAQEKWLAQAGCNAYNVGVAFFAIKRALEK